MKRSFHEAGLTSPSLSGAEGIGNIPIKTKSRACSECKKHKIRCQVDTGQQKCRRCLRQDLKCVTDNTLQKFVDGDKRWKASSSFQTSRLEAAMSNVLQHLRLPDLDSYGADSPVGKTPRELCPEVTASAPRYGPLDSIDATREPSHEPEFSPDSGMVVSAPTEALYEVTKLRNLKSDNGGQRPKRNLLESDFISRGVLPASEAEVLFDSFNNHMNQLLWGGIIMKHTTLESIRRSSSLLSSAILTVASIHIPGRSAALEACYDEYVSLVSMSLLRSCNLDDIRALCIGAFWLPDLSWRLSGHAVRLATEMGLQHAFQKMVQGDTSYYERAQLWYLLYVCDHQFATTYGRPPTIYEDKAITDYETFLRYPTTTPGDTRLMAQVALFIIFTRIYYHFGTNNDQSVVEEEFAEVQHYNLELDKWRATWQTRSADSQYVHTYPSKGVIMHYYFAKFQLNSLALRAVKPDIASPLSTARKESANIAISSAMSTLAFILDEPDVRNNILGVPLFTHTMLAFSAGFLLKVTLIWNSGTPSNQFLSSTNGIYINSDAVQDLVNRVILLLHRVASEKHLIHHIANGLSKMLASFKISMQPLRDNHLPPITEAQSRNYDHINDEHIGMPSISDDTEFSFNEIWQNFPAMTMDFLTSQWQDNEFGSLGSPPQ